MEIYFDNAATTKVLPEVRDIMVNVMETDYGNPSSKHNKGMEAEGYIRHAKELLSGTLKCKPQEIYFTSGGTESNNMALIGTAEANKRMGRHIITTQIEHSSVHAPLAYLEECGYEVTYLPVNSLGHIDTEMLAETVRGDTVLVSVMYVNNEVGSVENIQKVAQVVKSINKKVLFHVDAIQAYGKFKIIPKRLGIDLMSVSGHKFHGPKGSGFLYIKEGTKTGPILFGGGQQKGMRSGTENVPAIAGMAEAARIMYVSGACKADRLYGLKKHLINGLCGIEGVKVNAVPAWQGYMESGIRLNGNPETDKIEYKSLDESVRQTAPHIVSVSFDGIRSEVLLHALADKGIFVSSGSACSSNRPELSGTLKAIGVEDGLLDSTLRFSFSVYSTEDEIDKMLVELKGILPELRRFIRR